MIRSLSIITCHNPSCTLEYFIDINESAVYGPIGHFSVILVQLHRPMRFPINNSVQNDIGMTLLQRLHAKDYRSVILAASHALPFFGSGMITVCVNYFGRTKSRDRSFTWI